MREGVEYEPFSFSLADLEDFILRKERIEESYTGVKGYLFCLMMANKARDNDPFAGRNDLVFPNRDPRN